MVSLTVLSSAAAVAWAELAEPDFRVYNWSNGVSLEEDHPVVDLVTDLAKTAFSCGLAIEDPEEIEECAEDIIEFLIGALKDIYDAFTHDRTIHVRIPLDGASQFKLVGTYCSSKVGDHGLDTAWDHDENGLQLTFHNNGGIGGCQALQHTSCDWLLIVCVSNPIIGHNKARVAYVSDPNSVSMSQVYDAMEGWGQVHTADTVTLNQAFNRYDNPSTISYSLATPAECKAPLPETCDHLHTRVDVRYTGEGDSMTLSPTLKEGSCSIHGCGCRCKEMCESGGATHWTIDKTRQCGSYPCWQCYCILGEPGTASESDSKGWISGRTKYAPSTNVLV